MKLSGMRVVVLVHEGVEDLEYWVTVMRLQEEGAEVDTAGLTTEPQHGKGGHEVQADVLVSDVDPAAVDALVIPGGWAPDQLRRDGAVLDLVRAIDQAGKPMAVICHGGWVPASAGILQGRRATGSRGIKDDLVNAGATWVDEPAFRDGEIAWGRVVADIPVFLRETVALFAEHHERSHAPGGVPEAPPALAEPVETGAG